MNTTSASTRLNPDRGHDFMYRRALAFAVLVFLMVGTLGVQVYRSQLQLAKTRDQEQLLSIARLKVERINAWRRERLGDAEVLSANRRLMTDIGVWLKTAADDAHRADFTAVLEAMQRHYGYRDYLLVDAAGRVRLQSGTPSAAALQAEAEAALMQARRSREPQFTDLHTDDAFPYPHLGLVIPIDQGKAPVGALVLVMDARQMLYPLLETWPVPSATAETLLVRREGDEALFLNNLRHQSDTALRLRLPPTRADLPSTQAIKGARGVVEGRDYRGVPVLAAVFPVPDTPWFVIAKIDQQELYAGVRREALLAGGGWLTLLALAGAVLGLAWQRRQRKLEAAQAEASRRQRLILTGATDGLWDWNLQTGEDFHSARYQELLGYALGELPDTAAGFEAIVHPDDLPRVKAAQQAHLERREPYQVELRLRTKQGGYRWFVSRGQAEWDADGRPLRMAGFITDITERKTLDAALQEAGQRYINLLRATKDAFWLIEAGSGRLLDVNEAAVSLSGYTREELLTLRVTDLDIDFQCANFAAQVQRIRGEGWGLFESRHRRKDGQIIPVEVSVIPEVGEHKILAFIRDISERRRAEQAVRDSEFRWQFAIEGAGDGLWDWDVASGICFYSRRWKAMIGYAEDEIGTGLDEWTQRVHPEDREHVQATWQSHLDGTMPQHVVEYRLGHKDGSWVWILGRGQVSERDASGQPLRVIGTHTDITERKRMEAALVDLNTHLEQKVADRTAELAQRTADLARTSERLELAMQVTSDGVWDCDFQSEKVYCNANYFAMLGYGPDELGDSLDAVFTDLLPPEEREAIVESISQRFATEGGHESEFRMRAKDGSYRWVYARGRLIERDADGQPLRAIGTHVDITARKKAEEALQDLNATLEQRVAERTAQLAEAKAAAEAAARAKSEFLANMSHEIRTPMNAILGLTQILEREPLTPDQRDMLHKIGDSGAGLLHIINDILDFSKIEAGQLKVERCAFELSPVLDQLEALLTGSAAGKGLELRIDPPVGLAGPVIGDPLRIKQILLNLVSNAIKFTEQGAVTVRVLPLALTEISARLRFEVSDTGLGIAPAALAKLFQPFTQADASTTRRFGGTGLGLSICKRLVELMGGTIGATSELGAGSTFWFELPFERTATAAASTDEASAAPVQAGPRLQGLRVLAVDDNRINLFMLERALKLEGVSRVQLAADGQQALQILEADPQGFDCVLMDVQMPVMDGLTATRLIREHTELQALPVIALTAGVMAEERERAEAAGITGFLAKPLELAAMVTMLRPYASTGDD